MSMLELLELQARARAIRSQLALEPVTKIEIDSDSENSDIQHQPATKSKPSAKNFEPSQAPNKPSSTADKPDKNDEKSKATAESRPVRLKRNFRQRQLAIYEPTSGDEDLTIKNQQIQENEEDKTSEVDLVKTTTTEIVTVDNCEKSLDQTELKETEPVVNAETNFTPMEIVSTEPKADESSTVVNTPIEIDETINKSRSPSPDIVPIILEPPVFCISSDSEGEDHHPVVDKRMNLVTTSLAITINRPETEDEVFLRKVKASASVSKKTPEIVADKEPPIKELIPTKKPEPIIKPSPAVKEKPPVEEDKSEAEEGELSDDDSDEEDTESTALVAEPKETVWKDSHIEIDISSDNEEPEEPLAIGIDNEDITPSESSVKREVLELNYRTDDIVDIDDDEDIIDLGKDETLDFDVDTTEPAAADEEVKI